MKYYLIFLVLLLLLIPGCSRTSENGISQLTRTGSMPLAYATQFTVEYLEQDCALVSIADGHQYLVIPQNAEPPESVGEGITVIEQNPENAYVSASSAMDFFQELDVLDRVKMTSTKAADWCIPEIRELVDTEEIAFVGKYSSPDYEYLVSEDCDFVVESTMIYHSPEVKEKLEALGIPVLIERSSYESHPLGRMEWIKLYGLLFDAEEEAEQFFQEKCEKVEKIREQLPDGTKQTAAFFSISSNGYAVVRKPNDYISEMLRIGGGESVFTADDLKTDASALSSMNLQMESFYEKAKDADILIYNGAIDGGIGSIAQLLEKAPVLSDCKAVKNGNVWCTEKTLFQKTTAVAEMIADINQVMQGTEKEKLDYLYKVN